MRLASLALALVLISAPAAAAPQVPPAGAQAGAELEPMKLEAGVWDAVVTFPASTPDGQPTTAHGVQDNTLRSNGSWLINEFHIEGMPYEGSGMWGWDAATRRYVGVWGDSNEHRMRQDIGYWNADTRTMIWHTDLVRPDGMVTPMKMISRYDGDRRTFDIFAVGYKTGAETLLVHMDFTRRAAPPAS